MSSLSVLDDLITAVKQTLQGMQEDGAALFQHVYENGDFVDESALPIAGIDADQEIVTDHTTTRALVTQPIFIWVIFERPVGEDAPTPGQRHRQLLAALQLALTTGNGLAVPGITDILYAGDGAELVPLDEGQNPATFAFVAKFDARYRFRLDDPTRPA